MKKEQLEELQSQLTTDEKLGMIHGNELFATKAYHFTAQDQLHPVLFSVLHLQILRSPEYHLRLRCTSAH